MCLLNPRSQERNIALPRSFFVSKSALSIQLHKALNECIDVMQQRTTLEPSHRLCIEAKPSHHNYTMFNNSRCQIHVHILNFEQLDF